MDEYRRKVERLALERSGEPFFNASEDHAAIIVENMFRTAKREVCIMTSHLAPRIYGRPNGVQWANIFLADDEEHGMRIVMREGDLGALEHNPLAEQLRGRPNVEFRAIEDDFFDTLPYRFLVADGDSYRFEHDHTRCEAVAAFGASEAQNLQDVFDSLWGYAKAVNVDNATTLNPHLS